MFLNDFGEFRGDISIVRVLEEDLEGFKCSLDFGNFRICNFDQGFLGF
jgi:hypothetical protein